MNPIVGDVAKLMKTLRGSDVETLREAKEMLKEFSDAWLVSGDGKNLRGAGQCCLADSDLATGVIPVIETWIDNQS